MSFVYTTCNGTCPLTTAGLDRVRSALKARHLWGDRVAFVSITLDPERDTPEVLRRYASIYRAEPSRWHFLTGPPDRVRAVLKAWDMWARIGPSGAIDHPSRVFLIDPAGHQREIYSLETLAPEAVADDVASVLESATESVLLGRETTSMRLPRTSIAGLMGVVLVASLGLTAMRSGSAVWAGTTFLVTCGVLALAVVGVVCRGGAGRTWWLGFALFGWGYLVLAFRENASAANWNLPTVPLLMWIVPKPPRPGGMGGGFGGAGLGGGFGFSNPVDAYSQAGHCLIALLVATLGGLTALGLFGAGAFVNRQPGKANPVDTPPRRWWRRPAVVVTAGLVVALVAALVGLGRVPGYTAAVVFFVTWCLLGLAVVGAVFGPRGRRAAWLGAALFGIG